MYISFYTVTVYIILQGMYYKIYDENSWGNETIERQADSWL